MFGNLFKPQQQQGQQQQQFNQQNPNPGQNPQGSVQNLPQDSSNINQQGNQQMQQQQAPAKSPIDELTELFQNTNNQAGNGSNFFDVKPEQLQAITSKADFFQGMDPQLMQGMDPNQVKVMNTAMQQMMQQMLPLMVGITKTGGEHFSKQLSTELPQKMNAQSATQQFISSNPAAKPFANMMIQALQAKNPNMSPQELQGQAAKYFDQLFEAHAATKQQSSPQAQARNQETDWDAFFAS